MRETRIEVQEKSDKKWTTVNTHPLSVMGCRDALAECNKEDNERILICNDKRVKRVCEAVVKNDDPQAVLQEKFEKFV